MRLLIFGSLMILLASAGVGYLLFSEDPSQAVTRELIKQIGLSQQVLAQAKAGDVAAQLAVAMRLRQGLGAPRDPARAITWYKKAAKLGNVEARYQLGRMYDAGEGVAPEPRKALEWYRLAARLSGHADAAFRIGNLYFTGRGVTNDYGQAFDWFGRAADRGHAVAQHYMGAMYADGWGTERDLIEAFKWYSLASPQAKTVLAFNHTLDSAKALAKLRGRMNRFQIGEAEKRTVLWKQAHPGR